MGQKIKDKDKRISLRYFYLKLYLYINKKLKTLG